MFVIIIRIDFTNKISALIASPADLSVINILIIITIIIITIMYKKYKIKISLKCSLIQKSLSFTYKE